MTGLFWLVNIGMPILAVYTALQWRSVVDGVIPATDPDREIAEPTSLMDAMSLILGTWVLLFLIVGSVVLATRGSRELIEVDD
jgi:hypothetical protein